MQDLKEYSKWFKALRRLTFSRRGIAILKGSISYTIAFILIFLKPFDALSPYPQVLSSMMIVVAAGNSGKAIGATLSGNLLGAVGICIGALNFLILAKLSPYTVAQGIYFAFAVYCIAFVKAQGPRWLAATILAILMSFNGITSSYLVGSHFDHHYLIEYLKAYLWGTGINIFVCLAVFPISSEKELRKTLVTSLQHVETFGMLICQSYLMIISEDDRKLRDHLAQTIRADFGFLTQKLQETTLEINWSRWSLDDYRYFIAKTRALQLALISTHSSIAEVEKIEDSLYKTAFIPRTLGSFNRLRLDMRLTIREIEGAFGHTEPQLPDRVWDCYMDIERQAQASERPSRGRSNSFLDAADEADRAEELRQVASRLAKEFENGPHHDEDEEALVTEEDGYPIGEGPSPTETHGPGTDTPPATTIPPTPYAAEDRLKEDVEKAFKQQREDRGPHALKADFARFREVQHDLIVKTLTGGTLTDCSVGIPLIVDSPQPSVHDMYGYDYIRGRFVEPEYVPTTPRIRSPGTTPPASRPASRPVSRAPTIRQRKVRVQDSPERARSEKSGREGKRVHYDYGDTDSDEEEEPPRLPLSLIGVMAGDHSLIKVYSMLFTFAQYVHELGEFHTRVTAKDAKGRTPRKRLHFHFFETLTRPETPAANAQSGHDGNPDLSLPEAIAILEGKEWQPKKLSISQRITKLKAIMLGPNSIYAAKTAAACTVFALFVFADTTRSWFLTYNLNGGLITVVVALAPTLGQSAVTFLLQIAGSAMGYLVGLALLSIFHNVGGYIFNPYGIACLVFLYSIPFQYIIYEFPKYFPLALLALNGCGVLVATEWVYRDFYGRTFDSPAYRAGKALAALAVAIAIVTIFQLLVARNPARRSLRLALARISRANLAYLTLLQAFVRAVIPADPKDKVPHAAIIRVERELKKREIKIQGEIIGVMPLLSFAAAEPSLPPWFSPKPALKIIRANQVILDRLRESRDAIGTSEFNDRFLATFVAPLSPYRRRAARMTKTSLALSSASLYSKLPLPSDVPKATWNSLLPDFLHDALVLSNRFAATPDGAEAIKSGQFTRYWFYVLGITAIHPQLRELSEVCQQLFGKLEDTLS